MEKNNLIYSPAPHFHDNSSTSGIMRDVLIALAPSCIASVIIFGWKALALILSCVLTALISETLFNFATKKKNTISCNNT